VAYFRALQVFDVIESLRNCQCSSHIRTEVNTFCDVRLEDKLNCTEAHFALHSS
jgi:hypothetical protein